MKRYLFLAAYVATIPAANWMIGNVGNCVAFGPCVIPVGFGLVAPSGVLMVGASLVLRDLVHEKLGALVALLAIVAGAALSLLIAPPSLAIASAAAFLLSELGDMAVYTPLRKNSLWAAVLLSGVVGAVIDSAVFLLLAFGSLQFIEGQVVGKLWMTLSAVPVVWLMREHRRLFQGV